MPSAIILISELLLEWLNFAFWKLFRQALPKNHTEIFNLNVTNGLTQNGLTHPHVEMRERIKKLSSSVYHRS